MKLPIIFSIRSFSKTKLKKIILKPCKVSVIQDFKVELNANEI